MLQFILKRLLVMVPLVLIFTFACFVIIQLPVGDFVERTVEQRTASGRSSADILLQVEQMRSRYGLDKPYLVRYLVWVFNMFFKGELGRSFIYDKPVADIIGDRLLFTVLVSLLSTVFIWIVAVPIGIFSALRPRSLFDTFFTFLGFIGLAIPNFILALVIMYYAYTGLGLKVSGLFSPEFMGEPFSFAKLLDLFKHVWLPIVIIGTSGTASLIRVMRGTMLDELSKAYCVTAQAKGLSRRRALFKYPLRMAINPVISTIGWLLPGIISGEVLVSVVLNLPTSGPVLLQAILKEDTYLAGSFLTILGVLTLFGTLISDILLAVLDPRIRYGKMER